MYTIQENSATPTIGQMVAGNFRTAEVFRKYGIDFCCKGGRALADVCHDKNLDLSAIEEELEQKTKAPLTVSETEYNALSVEELIDHILNVHHTYVRESVPALTQFLGKIYKVHGERHPELAELFELFEGCVHELTHHLVKEEHILFPAARKMAIAKQNNLNNLPPFFFGPIQNPIGMMQHEHTAEGDRFARIAAITNNYTPPEDACTTYCVAYQKLEEFQNDLFTHIHLENNILFPKALQLEKEMIQ